MHEEKETSTINDEGTLVLVRAIREIIDWGNPKSMRKDLEKLFIHYCIEGETEVAERQDMYFSFHLINKFLHQISKIEDSEVKRILSKLLDQYSTTEKKSKQNEMEAALN